MCSRYCNCKEERKHKKHFENKVPRQPSIAWFFVVVTTLCLCPGWVYAQNPLG